MIIHRNIVKIYWKWMDIHHMDLIFNWHKFEAILFITSWAAVYWKSDEKWSLSNIFLLVEFAVLVFAWTQLKKHTYFFLELRHACTLSNIIFEKSWLITKRVVRRTNRTKPFMLSIISIQKNHNGSLCPQNCF